jgi:aspartyl-tRNA synthetase
VFQPEHAFFADAEAVRLESVLTVTGRVVARSPDTVNPNLPTGEVEVVADALVVEARDILQLKGADNVNF